MRSKSDLTHSMASARKELEGTLTSLFHGLATLQPRLALSWHEPATKQEASISSELQRTPYLAIVSSTYGVHRILASGKNPGMNLGPSAKPSSIDSLRAMGLTTTDIVGVLYVEELTILSCNWNTTPDATPEYRSLG